VRVVLITFGTEGDCRPILALARGLRAAGHEALVLGERTAAATAAGYGIPFETLEGDMQATLAPGGVLHKLMTEGGSVSEATRAFARIAQDNTAGWMARLLSAARGCDAIVFSGLAAYVGLSVAEHLGLPAIAAAMWPLSPTREFPSALLPPRRLPGWVNLASHRLIDLVLWRLFRPAVNAARQAVCGQAPRRAMWRDYPALYGMSPHLVPRPRDWQPEWEVCGAWTLPPRTGWQPPAALQAFLARGEAPLYVGFGSMAGFDRRKMVAALVAAIGDRRTLFYPGWSGIDLGALPDNFHVIGATPHDWLLPQVAAAIHHGGAGTTHAVARAGVPHIVLPFAGDQFFWAGRLAALGVAPRYVAGHRVDARKLSAMLAFVDQPGTRERARHLGLAIAAERGVAHAVASIERVCGQAQELEMA